MARSSIFASGNFCQGAEGKAGIICWKWFAGGKAFGGPQSRRIKMRDAKFSDRFSNVSDGIGLMVSK
jgi:hypothetical protein